MGDAPPAAPPCRDRTNHSEYHRIDVVAGVDRVELDLDFRAQFVRPVVQGDFKKPGLDDVWRVAGEQRDFALEDGAGKQGDSGCHGGRMGHFVHGLKVFTSAGKSALLRVTTVR